MLEPRELVAPLKYQNTLSMMDSTVHNIHKGRSQNLLTFQLLQKNSKVFMFSIRLGVPEMEDLWNDLCDKAQHDTLSKDDEKSTRKWEKLWLFYPAIKAPRTAQSRD